MPQLGNKTPMPFPIDTSGIIGRSRGTSMREIQNSGMYGKVKGISGVSALATGESVQAIKSAAGTFSIDAPNELMLVGAATAPLTGVGIFLGVDGADYEFRAGDPAGNYLHWNGSTLTIVGSITATTGTIGGWTIGATALTSGSGANSVGLDSGGTNPAFYAGSATPASAPFRVTQAGALVAASATITGSITSTVGTIGGWTLSSSDLSSGSVKFQSTAERVLLGSATAPLTGVGIFIGKDGSDYELRVGDPAGSYLHWNGSSLVVVGDLFSTNNINATNPVPGFIQLYLAGSFTSNGASDSAIATLFNTTLTGHSGDSAGLSQLVIDGAIVTAGNATLVSTLQVLEPDITVGAGTVTNAVSLYIQSAPTEGTNNYALWVDAGAVRFDSTLVVGTPQTYSITNVTTDRAYDANATSLDEVADALGTLIADLRTIGLVL